MRFVLFMSAVLLLLAGCASNEPYTQRDLHDVRVAYATLTPIVYDFRRAFFSNDTHGVLSSYHQERIACRLVDAINERDTINPNVKLWQASANLDDFCNDIESGFSTYAIAHHLPYDKKVNPSLRYDVMSQSKVDMKKMPDLLAHPADLS
jgi:hypothetical protein